MVLLSLGRRMEGAVSKVFLPLITLINTNCFILIINRIRKKIFNS